MMKELDCFPLDQLENLRDRYLARNDSTKARLVRDAISRRGAVQTQELSRCGKLFAVELPRDATGRVVTVFHGDNAAWMNMFMSGGVIGKVDHALVQQAYRQGGGTDE